MNQKQLTSPTKKLATIYILSLSIVAFFTIFGHFFVSSKLDHHETENEIIQLISEHRTNCQQISKYVLLIQHNKALEKNSDDEKALLYQALNSFKKTHSQLIQGHENLLEQSADNEVNVINSLFAEMPPNYRNIIEYSSAILNTNDIATFSEKLELLLESELGYLNNLDQIIFKYEEVGKRNMQRIETIDFTLICFSLLVLIIEGFFIFRPMANKIEEYFKEVINSNNALNELNMELEEVTMAQNKAEIDLENTLIKLKSLLNAATEFAIISFNKEGIIEMFNSGAKKMLGYNIDEAEAKLSIDILFDKKEIIDLKSNILAQNANEVLLSDFEVVIHELKSKKISASEFTLITKNNSKINVHLTLSEVKDTLGKSAGFLAIAHDISDTKRKNQELIQAKEQALDSMYAKENFLSTMSHEIRTPLNAVVGFTYLLLENNPKPEQLDNLNALKFSSDNLLVLINDILDFSKIEAGKVSFENIEFDLVQAINNITQSLNYKAKEREIEVRKNIDPNLPKSLIGDPVRLNQILTNLISNAIKFTEKGIVTICIKVNELASNAANIHFSIEDTGIGIEEDKIDLIFDSFTQASSDTTRKYGGTGLGLVITKRLLTLQNSDIKVKSQVGKGSEFYFDLAFNIGGPATSSLDKKEDSADILTGLHILLVEDNEINQKLATQFLKKWGCTFEIATNGIEAIEKILTKAFNIILMDLQMPEMDGYQATSVIRNMDDEYFKVIPILALTASALSDVKSKVLDAGMNDFVTKPFVPKGLFNKIGTLCNRMS